MKVGTTLAWDDAKSGRQYGRVTKIHPGGAIEATTWDDAHTYVGTTADFTETAPLFEAECCGNACSLCNRTYNRIVRGIESDQYFPH